MAKTAKVWGHHEEVADNSARFWSKVKKGSGCWEWTAGKDGAGYGSFGFRRNGKFKILGAHRLMYLFVKGEIPGSLCVCHTCDNPGCVNPDHLWLGTKKDNNADRRRKGRNGFRFKEICVRGHRLDGDNLYYYTSASGHPSRGCRACGRIRKRSQYAAKKARVIPPVEEAL